MRAHATPTCSFPGCDAPWHCRDLCRGHYQQRQKGRALAPILRRTTEVVQPSDHRLVRLGRTIMCAKVDVDDFASLSVLRWCLFKDGDRRYAYRFVTGLDGRRERRWMHRDILGVAPNPLLEVDHIDGDGLNNQRLNLRWTTKSYNQQNRRLSGGTSRLRGVRFKPNGRPWVAQIKHNGKLFHIGRYETETDAAVAYDTKAKELFGEHARTNFESC